MGTVDSEIPSRFVAEPTQHWGPSNYSVIRFANDASAQDDRVE